MVILSLLPAFATTQHHHFDKFLHAGAFFGLTASILFFIKRLSLNIWIAAFMTFIGAMIELMQHYVPGRSGTLGDMAADMVGILLAFFIARLYHSKKNKNTVVK